MLHVFQPLERDLIEFDPFTKLSDEYMVICSESKGKTNAMTASWGGFGELWGVDVVYAFVRESRYTKELLDNSDSFSCTFLDKSFRSAMKYFGSVTGRQEDKVKNAHMNYNYHKGVPFIDEGNFVFICEKLAAVPIGKECFSIPEIDEKWYAKGDYHTMYVGKIIQSMAR